MEVLNEVKLRGNIAAPVERRETKGGVVIAGVQLKVPRQREGAPYNFILSAFGDIAEEALKLEPETTVEIHGELTSRIKTSKHGDPLNSVEIVISSLTVLS